MSGKHNSIFDNFQSPPPRTTHTAPAGGSAPSSPAPPPAATAAGSAATTCGAAAAAAAQHYISASPAERSRCADAFSAEQRSTMARFGFAAAASAAAASSSASSSSASPLSVLLTRDRSKTSALVAELRREAELMKKADAKCATTADVAVAVAPSSKDKNPPRNDDDDDNDDQEDDDDLNNNNRASSPLSGTDMSQIDRFANIASQSATKQSEILGRLEQEKQQRRKFEAEQQRLKAERKEAAARQMIEQEMVDAVEKSMLHEAVGRSSCSASDTAAAQQNSNSPPQQQAPTTANVAQSHSSVVAAAATVENRKSGDGLQPQHENHDDRVATQEQQAAEAQQQQEQQPKRRVNFSHLPTNSKKLSNNDAALILQREFRRYLASAGAQRFMALEQLSLAWRRYNTSPRLTSPLICPFATGSVCTCPTTARWLRHDDANSTTNNLTTTTTATPKEDVSISCRTPIRDLPYHLQCLMAAALEFEVRQHSENLSMWYIYEGERSSHGRGSGAVPRLSEEMRRALREEERQLDNNHDDDNDDGEPADAEEQAKRHAEREHRNRILHFPEKFAVLRKAGPPASDVDEVLNMFNTAIAGGAAAATRARKNNQTSSSSKTAVDCDEKENSSSNDNKHSRQYQHERADEGDAVADPSVLELAVQWVRETLAPFSSSSICALLGGALAHEAALEVLSRREAKHDGQPLDCYSLGRTAPTSVHLNNNNNRNTGKSIVPGVACGPDDPEQQEHEDIDEHDNDYTSLRHLQRLPTDAGSGYDNARKILTEATLERAKLGPRHYREPIAPRVFFISMPRADLSAKEMLTLQQQKQSDSELGSQQQQQAADDAIQRKQALEKIQAWEDQEAKQQQEQQQQQQQRKTDLYSMLQQVPNPDSQDQEDEQEQPQHEEQQREEVELPPCPPLSEDEKALLKEMGENDPVIAQMLQQIQEADDEEYAAQLADTERRLAAVKAAQLRADPFREPPKSCGVGPSNDVNNDDDGDGTATHFVEVPAVDVRSSVLVRRKQQPQQAQQQRQQQDDAAKSSSSNNNNTICVICELDEIGTYRCLCGNYFHRDCGFAPGKDKAVPIRDMRCCASCSG